MREVPILFSATMVQAILAGRKTMTRRSLKPQPTAGQIARLYQTAKIDWQIYDRSSMPVSSRKFRWAPGDRLWCREAHWCYGQWHQEGMTKKTKRPRWCFKPIGEQVRYTKPADDELTYWGKGPGFVYRPGMFMPRALSRITLLVEAVRVERLQDISEADAVAEGIGRAPGGWWSGAEGQAASHAADAYAMLWTDINGPGSWDANPWVSVTTFSVATPTPPERP